MRRIFGIEVIEGSVQVCRQIYFVVWYCLLACTQDRVPHAIQVSLCVFVLCVMHLWGDLKHLGVVT